MGPRRNDSRASVLGRRETTNAASGETMSLSDDGRSTASQRPTPRDGMLSRDPREILARGICCSRRRKLRRSPLGKVASGARLPCLSDSSQLGQCHVPARGGEQVCGPVPEASTDKTHATGLLASVRGNRPRIASCCRTGSAPWGTRRETARSERRLPRKRPPNRPKLSQGCWLPSRQVRSRTRCLGGVRPSTSERGWSPATPQAAECPQSVGSTFRPGTPRPPDVRSHPAARRADRKLNTSAAVRSCQG